MSLVEQTLFTEKLNDACKMNGFDGICLKRNGVEYDFHPNYKKRLPIDYTEYVNQIGETSCMFFDFNNHPRFHFNKSKPCTVYTNVTEQAQDRFMKKALRKDVVLFNAWNEWGETMTMEPGTQTKNTRLLMLKHNCLPFLTKKMIQTSTSGEDKHGTSNRPVYYRRGKLPGDGIIKPSINF
jgi:hypothetical protein